MTIRKATSVGNRSATQRSEPLEISPLHNICRHRYKEAGSTHQYVCPPENKLPHQDDRIEHVSRTYLNDAHASVRQGIFFLRRRAATLGFLLLLYRLYNSIR